MAIVDDLKRIQTGGLSDLDVITFVEEKTSNYNLKKLEALETALQKYIPPSIDIRESDLYGQIEYLYDIKRNEISTILFNSLVDDWRIRAWNLEISPFEFYGVPKKTSKPILKTLNELSKRISGSIDPVQVRILHEFSGLFKVQKLVRNKIEEIKREKDGQILEFNELNRSNPITSKLPKESVQIGRPEDFPSEKTLQWFTELKNLEEYQHKNGKPHKTKIKKKIIERHGTLRKDGNEPSMDTINVQFRKLGLTR